MTDFRRIDELFNAARLLAPDARPAFLAQACDGDAPLRCEVERLLDLDDRPPDFLQSAAIDRGLLVTGDPFAAIPHDEPAPTRIGAYRIQHVIGQGGFGIVYRAEQDYPRRTVALKVIRPNIATPAMLRRFEVEAQILARLTHPGIAQIYEAGTDRGTDGVRAFFAMEYIHGERLDRFADAKGLSTPDRLELVARVCDAVQYAHQKGVIHRDLKPPNILVVEEETETPRPDPARGSSANLALRTPASPFLGAFPKILDFGVARSTDPDIHTTTLHTSPGQLIGTLPYMSPEQVSGDSEDVDTRSDVYALGVVLYELLTGRLPFELTNCSILEAARRIRDEAPVPAGRVNAALRGDVEAIVSKALDKDKLRRYPTAAELAADIRRHLSGHPVEAKGRSGLYVLRKTLVRHKWATAGAAAFLLVLIGASAGLSILYREARSQTAVARQERDKSAAAEQEARREQHKAQRVADLVCSLLQTADARSTPGRDRTVREVLDGLDEAIAEELRGEPDVEATLRLVVGQAYQSLGLFGPAESHMRKSLALRRAASPEPDALVGETCRELGSVLVDVDKEDEGLALLQEALTIQRQTLPPGDERIGWDLLALGMTLINRQRMAEAEPLFAEAMEIVRKLPVTTEINAGRQSALVEGLNSMAFFHFHTGDYSGAEAYSREAMDVCKRWLGDESATMAVTLNNFAAIRKAQGHTDELAPLYERALTIARQTVGPRHPDTASALCSLGITLLEQDRAAEAEPHLREALSIRRERLPDGHLATAEALNCLGRILVALNRPAEAEPLLREALAIRTAALPANDFLCGTTKVALGGCLLELGRPSDAEPLLTEAYRIVSEAKGPTHWAALQSADRLTQLYTAAGRSSEADAWRSKSKPEPPNPPSSTQPSPPPNR